MHWIGIALGQLLEKREQSKAGVRAKIEHSFHVVRSPSEHRKTSYHVIVKHTAQLLTLFGLADLIAGEKALDGITCFKCALYKN